MATLPKTRRSGGPKTPEGKLVSSRNAIKTGAYAVQTLLPGESEPEFRELEQLFIDDFSPSGIAEAALVHSSTVIIWKKLRLEKLESRHIHDPLDRIPRSSEFSAVGFDDYPQTAKEWVNRPEKISSLNLEQVQSGYWTLKSLNKSRFGEDMDDRLIEQLQGEIWAIQNQEKLLKVRQQIRDKRLVEFLNLNRSQRVSDDFDRAYFKTLDELRKQKEWRRRQEAVDVKALVNLTPKLPTTKKSK